jgi:hypothetical protein
MSVVDPPLETDAGFAANETVGTWTLAWPIVATSPLGETSPPAQELSTSASAAISGRTLLHSIDLDSSRIDWHMREICDQPGLCSQCLAGA